MKIQLGRLGGGPLSCHHPVHLCYSMMHTHSHVAMGMDFEKSLQSVDPAVTLPYWDFTMDAHKV